MERAFTIVCYLAYEPNAWAFVLKTSCATTFQTIRTMQP